MVIGFRFIVGDFRTAERVEFPYTRE